MIERLPACGALLALSLGWLLGTASAAADLFENLPSPAGGALTIGSDAGATLIVFNSNDAESRELASFYAGKRGIPKERILGLPCSAGEEITRVEYDHTLLEPLRRAFTANFWWKLRGPESLLGPVESNKIRFIALMRGIPLKISGVEHYPGDAPAGPPPIGSRNDAAVDSELATMGFFAKTISGPAGNPYYRSFLPIADLPHPELILVCRLDGPSASVVRQMIIDGLAAEREGLAGFAYVDARGLTSGGYLEGDEWLRADVVTLRRQGLPVVFDDGPDLFPEGYPMRQAAIYYGWYSGDVAGPFKRTGFKFIRGAVAVHIHSFSAATVRDSRRCWVGPLLAAGAACTLGNVYEPYLTLTPHLDVFHDRLRAGFSFAEAGYMSMRVVSWMTTFVGDPLYRPFKGVELGDEQPRVGEWAAYREAARLWFTENRAAGEVALKAAGKRLRSGMIFEGLGLLETSVEDAPAAISAFQQARKIYANPDDVTRVALHELVQLRKLGQNPEAATLAHQMIADYPKAAANVVLRTFLPPEPK